MKEPEWIEPDVVLAIHEAQLAENGGAVGIRDDGLLESALARPKNLYSYSSNQTLRILRQPMPPELQEIIRSSMATSERPGCFARSSSN